jgi:hypothetical protein
MTMRRLISLLGALTILLGVSGSASGAYWEVTYDLTGSQLTTTIPGLATDVDPVTGTWTFQYDANPRTGPVTGARMMSGTDYTLFYMQMGSPPTLTVTGHANTVLLPPASGQPGTLTGDTLIVGILPDSDATGYNHCTAAYNAICVLAGWPGRSTNNPLTPATRPKTFPIPNLVFTSGTAGVGNFTSTAKSLITSVPAQLTLQWIFKGSEISRVYHADVPAVSNGGLAGLGLFLVLGATATLRLRRRRS